MFSFEVNLSYFLPYLITLHKKLLKSRYTWFILYLLFAPVIKITTLINKKATLAK